MNFRLVPKWVTLNGVMALILRYFTEFGSFRGALRKSSRSLSHRLMSSCDLVVVPRVCFKKLGLFVDVKK